MQLTLTTYPKPNYFHEIAEQLAEQNLVYYASEAAQLMQFESQDELNDAVKRAMEVCQCSGYSLKNNFKRVFKSTPYGLVYDWKLSVLAYNLVMLNGSSMNRLVASLQVSILKKCAYAA